MITGQTKTSNVKYYFPTVLRGYSLILSLAGTDCLQTHQDRVDEPWTMQIRVHPSHILPFQCRACITGFQGLEYTFLIYTRYQCNLRACNVPIAIARGCRVQMIFKSVLLFHKNVFYDCRYENTKINFQRCQLFQWVLSRYLYYVWNNVTFKLYLKVNLLAHMIKRDSSIWLKWGRSKLFVDGNTNVGRYFIWQIVLES